MKKSIRLVLISIICFFSILCFAAAASVSVNQKDVILPHFEEFKLLTDKNSAEFKQLEAQYSAHQNTITYAHYYELNPGKIARFMTILGFTNSPEYITKKDWTEIKHQINEDYQKPTTVEEENNRSIRTTIESITNNDLFDTYISESKVYQKDKAKFQHAFTNLDAKTYLYLNGKIVIISITIEGDNAYNVSTLQWAKTTSKIAAEEIIKLNPPTEKDLNEAQKYEQNARLNQIKIALLIFVVLLGLLWKFKGYSKTPKE